MRLLKRRRKTEYDKIKELIEKAYRTGLERWQRKYVAPTKEAYDIIMEHYIREYKYAQEKGTDFNPVKAFQSEANAASKRSGEGTRRWLFEILKKQRHPDYNHLNTYLYRLGYSVANYFNDPSNSTIDVHGSIITMTLDLPIKMKGKTYSQFYMEYNKSGGEQGQGEITDLEFRI